MVAESTPPVASIAALDEDEGETDGETAQQVDRHDREEGRKSKPGLESFGPRVAKHGAESASCSDGEDFDE